MKAMPDQHAENVRDVRGGLVGLVELERMDWGRRMELIARDCWLLDPARPCRENVRKSKGISMCF